MQAHDTMAHEVVCHRAASCITAVTQCGPLLALVRRAPVLQHQHACPSARPQVLQCPLGLHRARAVACAQCTARGTVCLRCPPASHLWPQQPALSSLNVAATYTSQLRKHLRALRRQASVVKCPTSSTGKSPCKTGRPSKPSVGTPLIWCRTARHLARCRGAAMPPQPRQSTPMRS